LVQQVPLKQRYHDLSVVSEAGDDPRDCLAVAAGEWGCIHVRSTTYIQIGMIEEVVEFRAELQLQIERLFAWLQNFRRLVVRYERYAENFLGMLHLGCCIILLRHL
jgi:transposase